MLRWSATTTERPVDIRGIVDPAVDPGPPGGVALTALGRAAVGWGVDSSPTDVVAEDLGPAAAVDAAAVAAAFELYNRVVDAAGLPYGRMARERMSDVIQTLGLAGFPHADW